MTTAALIVAAGLGTRTGLATPKQYALLAGEPVLARTLSVFLAHPAIDLVMVAIAEADRARYAQVVGGGHPKLRPPVVGGATRQRSVLNGLRALRGEGGGAQAPARVLIHDAARPFLTAAIIDRVLAALQQARGAIAAVPLADTLKRDDGSGRIAGTIEREGLWRAQTPQGFDYAAILAAHEAALAAGRDDLTDDAAVAEWAGMSVALVPGSESNIKLTTAEDMARAEDIARAAQQAAAGADGRAERATADGNRDASADIGAAGAAVGASLGAAMTAMTAMLGAMTAAANAAAGAAANAAAGAAAGAIDAAARAAGEIRDAAAQAGVQAGRSVDDVVDDRPGPAGQSAAQVAGVRSAPTAATAATTAAAAPAAGPDIRTGQGFDVHRFAAGDHVWLCGVRIPHSARLDGHSDADVGLHALTDALLGAIGDGDIGQHFPPSDQQWRGAASHLFLADAARRVRARGGRIANVDVTLLCEAPRIAPHRDAMRARIAEVLGLAVERVAVKATTTEGLGFPGRREGIAAMATATVVLP